MVAGAQTFRGLLTGTVVDTSDAAIPNATVRLTNPETNDVSNSKTNGAVSDDRNSIYNFSPDRGYFKAPLYARNLGNVAPRFGFAFIPFKEPTTVFRGAFGLFYDQPTVGQFAYNSVGNGASAGIFGTPGDANAAITVNGGAGSSAESAINVPTLLQAPAIKMQTCS